MLSKIGYNSTSCCYRVKTIGWTSMHQTSLNEQRGQLVETIPLYSPNVWFETRVYHSFIGNFRPPHCRAEDSVAPANYSIPHSSSDKPSYSWLFLDLSKLLKALRGKWSGSKNIIFSKSSLKFNINILWRKRYLVKLYKQIYHTSNNSRTTTNISDRNKLSWAQKMLISQLKSCRYYSEWFKNKIITQPISNSS